MYWYGVNVDVDVDFASAKTLFVSWWNFLNKCVYLCEGLFFLSSFISSSIISMSMSDAVCAVVAFFQSHRSNNLHFLLFFFLLLIVGGCCILFVMFTKSTKQKHTKKAITREMKRKLFLCLCACRLFHFLLIFPLLFYCNHVKKKIVVGLANLHIFERVGGDGIHQIGNRNASI